MELWIGLGLVIPVLAFLIWRSRRVGTNGPDSYVHGLPNDMRDRHTVENSRAQIHDTSGGFGSGPGL